MKWKDKLIHDLLEHCERDENATKKIKKIINQKANNIHLAIFNEPFLSMIFNRVKTIESRFSINQVIPFRRIHEGDLVIMKRSGGNIEGYFFAGNVKYYTNLAREKINKLNEEYGKQIGWDIDPEFLVNRNGARFLSLTHIAEVYRCKSFTTAKKGPDRMEHY